VPEWLAPRFAGAAEALESHRGWDPGALGIARCFVASLGFEPLVASSSRLEARTSRLVVDPNRSEDSPSLFSEVTRELPLADRKRILADHYHPYRDWVHDAVRESVDKGICVMHISVHTFDPVLGSDRRDFDAGILFDPGRALEAAVAREWIASLRAGPACIDVRENQPYLGTDDGVTTSLRSMFPPSMYVGVEVEVRNDLVRESDEQDQWGSRLAASLLRVLRG
jgi:predicted N-formylglutamate amidohydrolase